MFYFLCTFLELSHFLKQFIILHQVLKYTDFQIVLIVKKVEIKYYQTSNWLFWNFHFEFNL